MGSQHQACSWPVLRSNEQIISNNHAGVAPFAVMWASDSDFCGSNHALKLSSGQKF